MIFVEILGHSVFWLVMLVSVGIIVIGLPGTFLIVGNSAIYGWFTDFTELTVSTLFTLVVIAIVAEAIEFFIGAATAGKYGGSKKAMIGAVVGGFVGAIWMSPMFPVVGTIAGAFAGAFAGATLMEYIESNDINKAINVGFGAFLGTVGGKLTKVAAGVGMVVIVGLRVF